MNQYNDQRATAALQQGNKSALYQGILDSCAGMRTKLHLMMSGQLKRAVSVFNDPNNPKKQLRVIQTVEDGRLKTTYWMDDSNIWRYCAKRRREFDENRRHAATTGHTTPLREYFLSSWLLETYILLKYGIDLRSSDWGDPSTSDFKRVSWIMDHDEFANKYKLTTYSESRGQSNPFNETRVDMAGLDLSAILNNNKGSSDGNTSSASQSQRITEPERLNSSD